MAAKKILMLVGDFVEDYEAMVPFQMLQMVGHEVHAVDRFGEESAGQEKTGGEADGDGGARPEAALERQRSVAHRSVGIERLGAQSDADDPDRHRIACHVIVRGVPLDLGVGANADDHRGGDERDDGKTDERQSVFLLIERLNGLAVGAG